MKQADNVVKIEGLLSENKLKEFLILVMELILKQSVVQ